MSFGLKVLVLLSMLFCGAAKTALANDEQIEAYANGAIIVKIDKSKGFWVGDPVLITVDFVTDPAVDLNLDTLVSGKFTSLTGSDFELKSKPVVKQPVMHGQKLVTRVEFEIVSWVKTPTPVTIDSQFLYATSKLRGKPIWQPATTPFIMIP